MFVGRLPLYLTLHPHCSSHPALECLLKCPREQSSGGCVLLYGPQSQWTASMVPGVVGSGWHWCSQWMQSTLGCTGTVHTHLFTFVVIHYRDLNNSSLVELISLFTGINGKQEWVKKKKPVKTAGTETIFLSWVQSLILLWMSTLTS